MAVHVMVDLETWGTLPGSAVRSIGACVFDPEAGTIQPAAERFYVNVSTASCLEAGLLRDPKTVAWWAEQGAEAQAALVEHRLPLKVAVEQFAAWWASHGARHFWSHGACFDEPILRLAMLAGGQAPPWRFWDVRDTRTVYALAGVSPDKSAGVQHHALDDAVRQARAVIEGYARLTRRLGAGEPPPPRFPVGMPSWLGVDRGAEFETRWLEFKDPHAWRQRHG